MFISIQALVYHYVESVGQLSHKRKFIIELAPAVKKNYGTDRYKIHTKHSTYLDHGKIERPITSIFKGFPYFASRPLPPTPYFLN